MFQRHSQLGGFFPSLACILAHVTKFVLSLRYVIVLHVDIADVLHTMCAQIRDCSLVSVGGCTAGLIEVREFLARFVDQTPNLADLEAAFADPTAGQHHMQVTSPARLTRTASGGKEAGGRGKVVRKGVKKIGLGKAFSKVPAGVSEPEGSRTPSPPLVVMPLAWHTGQVIPVAYVLSYHAEEASNDTLWPDI